MKRLHIPQLWRYVAVAIGALLWFGGGVAADTAQTNFSQRILPLDCVFTVINAGTGELYYLTPKECGAAIPPPPASSQSSSGKPSATSTTLGPAYPFFLAPSSNNTTGSSSSGNDSSGQLVSPGQPIAGTQGQSTTKSDTGHRLTFREVVIASVAMLILFIVLAVVLR